MFRTFDFSGFYDLSIFLKNIFSLWKKFRTFSKKRAPLRTQLFGINFKPKFLSPEEKFFKTVEIEKSDPAEVDVV